jgi:hypothetical protein
MKFTQTTEASYLNLTLSNGMALFISDGAGHPTITVRQPSREIGPDAYEPGGSYEITLPDAIEVAERCSAREAGDYDKPGTATITVIHRH